MIRSRLINVSLIGLGLLLLGLAVAGTLADREISAGAVFLGAVCIWCGFGGTFNLLRAPSGDVRTEAIAKWFSIPFFPALLVAVASALGAATVPNARIFEILLFVAGDVLVILFIAATVIGVYRWVRPN